MRLLKTVLDFYIKSSLHVAICFVALLYVFHCYSFVKLSEDFALLGFCFVVIGYNFIKYATLVYENRDFKYKIGIFIITVISALVGAYLLLFESLQAYIVLLISGLLSLFYVIPFYHKKSLRLMSIIKVITVVVVWWLVIMVLPVYSVYSEVVNLNVDGLNSIEQINWTPYIIKSVELFLFVFSLLIPFEIRDLKYDDPSLKTIPQLVGTRKTKYLGIVLLLCAFLLHHFYFMQYEFPYYFIPLLIYVITAIAIWFSDKFKADYYVSFFVEAIPVFWLALYWMT
ncbi:hypothetical protein LY01_01594 [Nonlabens xylanidelens]|uniref:UbiA prenyltransferase family protein n=1 Tax=Nonlabens xylanidelens TaxID=191564 RepID=A0A2S6IKZ3_9FLAO|nr:hypothetical protein [Nonlabens xylanidelens]PPK94841.1 hypothetical protein LY01_01594 [Nonlabens xylanidelens]